MISPCWSLWIWILIAYERVHNQAAFPVTSLQLQHNLREKLQILGLFCRLWCLMQCVLCLFCLVCSVCCFLSARATVLIWFHKDFNYTSHSLAASVVLICVVSPLCEAVVKVPHTFFPYCVVVVFYIEEKDFLTRFCSLFKWLKSIAEDFIGR